MVDAPAYISVNCIFYAVIVESEDVRIFVEESQDINEALFCVLEHLPDFVAEAHVIPLCLRVGNVNIFRRNIEVSKPKEESIIFAVNDIFDAGEKFFLDGKIGVVDGFPLRNVSVENG